MDSKPKKNVAIRFFLYFLLSLFIFLVATLEAVSAAPPFEAQASTNSQGLKITYIEAQAYIQNTEIDLQFHVYDSNNTLIMPTAANLNCTLHIYGVEGNHLFQERIYQESPSSKDLEAHLNTSLTENLGWYPYLLSCDGIKEDGYLSNYYLITRDGRVSTGTWELPIALILTSVVVLLIWLANSWDIVLFDFKKDGSKSGVIKVFLIGIGIWLVPILIQMGTEIAEANNVSADVLTLLESLYGAVLWINIVLDVLLAVILLLNLLIYLGVDVVGAFGGNSGGNQNNRYRGR